MVETVKRHQKRHKCDQVTHITFVPADRLAARFTFQYLLRRLVFNAIESWGLYPLLPLNAAETENDYSQLWVLSTLGDQEKVLKFRNYQMLFPQTGLATIPLAEKKS